jgi:hypothetical protein
MGYLQEKQAETQRLLDFYNYELSEEVTNQKKEWEKEICKRIDKDDQEDIVLDIEEFGITVEIDVRDEHLDEYYTAVEDIIKVAAYNGEVYVEDRNENEYYIVDLYESTFKQIYEAVIDLTNSDYE